MAQGTNLIQLNGLTKLWKKREVAHEYRVQKEGEITLELELSESVINTGFSIWTWCCSYSINDVVEYGVAGSSSKGSDIYEELIMWFLFLRRMECVPVDTWELVRMDVKEFMGSGNLASLN